MMILMGFVGWMVLSVVVALGLGPVLRQVAELRDAHSRRQSRVPTGRLTSVA